MLTSLSKSTATPAKQEHFIETPDGEKVLAWSITAVIPGEWGNSISLDFRDFRGVFSMAVLQEGVKVEVFYGSTSTIEFKVNGVSRYIKIYITLEGKKNQLFPPKGMIKLSGGKDI